MESSLSLCGTLEGESFIKHGLPEFGWQENVLRYTPIRESFDQLDRLFFRSVLYLRAILAFP